MSLLPPLLPELNGGRPAAGSVGQAAATIRLGARVVAITGADLLIETGHGRALLQGAPALRPGAALLLEVQYPEPALARTGRVVAVGQQRLEPPLPVRLHPVSPSPTAATMRSAAALEVSLRTLGPDGRPTTPAFPARLAVPEPAPALPGSSAMVVSPSGGAARGSALPGASSPADTVLPTNAAVAPTAGRPAAAPGLTGPSTASAVTRAPPAPTPLALAQQPGVPAGPGHLIEVVVLPRDALGRILLRAPAFTFQVDTPVDLPVGARLQLSLPGPPRSSAAPLQAGPLEAVRTLAASLRPHPGSEESLNAGTLRLPEPTATLAARLLRLVQLVAPRSGDVSARSPAEPATIEGQPGAARITAALAELGRLAAEPQSGGWRVLLLPLAIAGTPLLRLYLREHPSEHGGRHEQPDRSRAARRAVFELEFGELGRCQIDVLCQARRFDLLVGTERPLPPQLRRDIRELYRAARESAGLVGEVRFRAGQLLALPEPTGAAGPGSVTV